MKCTCDDFCDSPCPEHGKFNELQNSLIRLVTPATCCPDCGAEPGVNIDCKLCEHISDMERVCRVARAAMYWWQSYKLVDGVPGDVMLKEIISGSKP